MKTLTEEFGIIWPLFWTGLIGFIIIVTFAIFDFEHMDETGTSYVVEFFQDKEEVK